MKSRNRPLRRGVHGLVVSYRAIDAGGGAVAKNDVGLDGLDSETTTSTKELQLAAADAQNPAVPRTPASAGPSVGASGGLEGPLVGPRGGTGSLQGSTVNRPASEQASERSEDYLVKPQEMMSLGVSERLADQLVKPQEMVSLGSPEGLADHLVKPGGGVGSPKDNTTKYAVESVVEQSNDEVDVYEEERTTTTAAAAASSFSNRLLTSLDADDVVDDVTSLRDESQEYRDISSSSDELRPPSNSATASSLRTSTADSGTGAADVQDGVSTPDDQVDRRDADAEASKAANWQGTSDDESGIALESDAESTSVEHERRRQPETEVRDRMLTAPSSWNLVEQRGDERVSETNSSAGTGDTIPADIFQLGTSRTEPTAVQADVETAPASRDTDDRTQPLSTTGLPGAFHHLLPNTREFYCQNGLENSEILNLLSMDFLIGNSHGGKNKHLNSFLENSVLKRKKKL